MSSRQTRMNKYYDDNEENSYVGSRLKKNENLYKEVSNLELEDFDLNSNVSVIGNNTDNISLDEIKDILDKKYHEHPKKKSFGDTDEITLPEIHLDETREYDINTILEKAKEKQEINYEEERLKKIRNTQYDILKNLDIIGGEEEIEENDSSEKPTDRRPTPSNPENEKKLHDLIDTITAKELIKNEENLEVTGEMDPLDILSDLRGDDESTKVMGMLDRELQAAMEENEKVTKENTLGIETKDVLNNNIEETEKLDLTEGVREISENDSNKKKDEKLKNIDNSFIGNTTTFTQSDFDDFNDLKADMHITKVIIRILIFAIIVIFLIALVVLANKYLGLGLF